MGGLTDQSALSGYADGSKCIVARDHSAGQMGRAQSMDGWCCAWFELVLEYDQAEEAKAAFCLFSVESLQKTQ